MTQEVTQLSEQASSLKLESNNDEWESNHNHLTESCVDDSNREEKESSNDLEVSHITSRSRTPLAVPMVADSLQHSVTRSDAKVITQSRLNRLKALSQRSDEQLSKDQKDEKKRIIRLEKNRRAAAMSRRKKKMYVKGMEEKYQLMARHLAILEMENAHLRAILNASQHANIQAAVIGGPPPPPITFKMPSNIHSFQSTPGNLHVSSNTTSNSDTTNNSSSANTVHNTHTSTCMNSIEPSATAAHYNEHAPLLKRRKLNNGTSASVTPAADNASDVSLLEPLPIHDHGNDPLPPAPAMPVSLGFMPSNLLVPPNLVQPRIVPYPAPHLMSNMRAHAMSQPQHNCCEGDQESRSASVVIERDNIVQQSDLCMHSDNDDLPPAIEVPELTNEHFSIYDDDVIEETVDEYGTVTMF